MDIKKAEQSFTIGKDLSDFLVWRKDGVAAYELATVVDDYFMKITEVVAGRIYLSQVQGNACYLMLWVGQDHLFTIANYCLEKMGKVIENISLFTSSIFEILISLSL